MISSEQLISAEDADFIFENKLVRIVALRNSSKIELAGISVGPFEEGNEYEVRLWIARELERAGIARLRRDIIDISRLYKIQWVERVQSVGQISSLPEDFYPRLRRLIADLRELSKNNPEKLKEYEYVRRLSQDIVNCRLKKIISLASIPGPKEHILKNLTIEEKELYEKLNKIINEWRSGII